MKRTRLLIHIGIIAASLATLAFIIVGAIRHWSWAGFDRPLYDWMQLLIIPIALAWIAARFNRVERKNEQTIATDNQQEAALQSYFDHLSELLIEKKLRESRLGDEIRNVARMRTLTTLYQLNTRRKEYLIGFLRESGLLASSTNTNVISLRNADLRNIDFHEINLDNIDLSEANFRGADLRSTNLYDTNLSNANLRGANLSGADLEAANLREAVLIYANLRRTHLYNTNLSGAFLNNANLRNAIIYQANLNHAVLIGADLRGAKLCEANLKGANLMATNLRGADLRGADLSGVIIDTMSLAKARVTEEQKATLSLRVIHNQRHRLPLTHRGLRNLLSP